MLSVNEASPIIIDVILYADNQNGICVLRTSQYFATLNVIIICTNFRLYRSCEETRHTSSKEKYVASLDTVFCYIVFPTGFINNT